MGTEILRPQDCLIERIRVPPASFYRRKSYYGNPNPNPNPNPKLNPIPNFYYHFNPRSTRKQQSVLRSEKRDERKQQRFGSTNQSEPSVSKRTSSGDLSAMKTMEKVTILRRGESLDSKIKSSDEALKKEGDGLVVVGTKRLGPGPEMVPKQTRIVDLRSPVLGKPDVYAGSAFAVSPEPSSLPLPSFPKKKQVFAIVDDSATRDLRRLLRLD